MLVYKIHICSVVLCFLLCTDVFFRKIEDSNWGELHLRVRIRSQRRSSHVLGQGVGGGGNGGAPGFGWALPGQDHVGRDLGTTRRRLPEAGGPGLASRAHSLGGPERPATPKRASGAALGRGRVPGCQR